MNRNHSRGRSAAPEQRGNTLLGIAVGVVIGILASLIVVWLMNRNPSPFVNKAQQPPAGGQAAEPQPLPAKPGDQPQEKRFQFYEILPGKTAPQPSPAKPVDPRKPAAGTPPAPAAGAGEVYLQAGSFQTAKDAENFRASLALIGMEAAVQPAKVGDKQWYRVRLGPYARFEDAHQAKVDLAKAGIEAELRRGKE